MVKSRFGLLIQGGDFKIRNMGKVLVQIGLFLVIVGLFLYLFESTAFRIPGDVVIKRPNVTIFIPIGSSFLLSLILTLLLNIIFRVKK